MVLKEHRESQELVVVKGLKGHVDLKELKGRPELREVLVLKETEVLKVRKVAKEQLE